MYISTYLSSTFVTHLKISNASVNNDDNVYAHMYMYVYYIWYICIWYVCRHLNITY